MRKHVEREQNEIKATEELNSSFFSCTTPQTFDQMDAAKCSKTQLTLIKVYLELRLPLMIDFDCRK